ncbi:Tripartite motif-containing protein 10 [Varanus komodoensis]|uniref:tripartite motif-containing protein 10-like n=1 Tax=Varanus komodoensis TaxID=61221 RepID=UPI001CF7AAC9|nr:tripartite motif-containing protein 10-like [Varanus komodoensis]KAF7235296.1 Tripartite motif-containing protein 10 [Varanus komodoensis]
MASASTCTEVEQEAQCPICWEYLREPVTLDCGHNFCRKCISFYSEICEEIKDLECPLCSIQIRKEPFRSNWQLRNLIEAIKRLLNPRKEDVCAEHKKKLQLFCKEDEELVCSVCRCSREHRTHTVVTLEKVSQGYKDQISGCLKLLKDKKAALSLSISNTEKKSQDLLNQVKAEKQKTAAHFRELHQFLETEEYFLLAQIQEMEKEIVRNKESHVARLSEELSSLDTPMKELEEKCQQVPSKLLQDIKGTLKRCHMEKQEHPEAFPSATKWRISNLCDINYFLEGATNAFKDTVRSGYHLQKESVILDQNTAHAKLILSNDKKSVWVADGPQVLPEKLSQFDHWQCVLGTKGFVSGRHFWEILVENQEKWSIGVAQGSVPRKGRFPLGPVEGIWAVGKWDRQYWALDCPGRLRLSPERDLKRIRVTLNYLGGRVAFFDADTEELLFAFSSALFYEEKLYPFIWVWGTSYLRLCS